MIGPEKRVNAPEKAGDLSGLDDLAELADDLAEAIAGGDVQTAREAHSAIGRGLSSTSEHPDAIVDLARERARRAPRVGKGE